MSEKNLMDVERDSEVKRAFRLNLSQHQPVVQKLSQRVVEVIIAGLADEAFDLDRNLLLAFLRGNYSLCRQINISFRAFYFNP